MRNTEIQIKIPKEVKAEFKNVAKNKGTTMSALLNHHIHELLSVIPEHMKRVRPD